jgi:RimJ/RimL family protein N-acetyltransferase/acyl carrier protein
MKKKILLQILSSKCPIDDGNNIIFLPILKSKKYFNQFFEYSKKEVFFKYFEYSSFRYKSELTSYIAKLIKVEKNNGNNSLYQKFWLVIDKTNDKLVGSAKLSSLDPVRRSVEWGYGINSDMWGSPYILKLQKSLLNYIFNTLGLNRLYGHTHVKNYNVIKGVEKLGFRKEGVKFDYYYHQKNKTFFDAYAYSMLKRDFLKRNTFVKNLNKGKKNSVNILSINKVIQKITKSKICLTKNLTMNDVMEWDSVSHFDLISQIEKKFNKKFSNKEILVSTSTKNILKILSKNN